MYKDGNFVAKRYLEGSKPSLMGGASPTIQCGQNRGFVGNLKGIGKTIAHTKDSQDELEDVQRCAAAIYSSMTVLGQ